MISLVKRLSIVAAVVVSIMAVVLILLMQEGKVTWPMVFAIIVIGIIAMVVNYLYWRPRYRDVPLK